MVIKIFAFLKQLRSKLKTIKKMFELMVGCWPTDGPLNSNTTDVAKVKEFFEERSISLINDYLTLKLFFSLNKHFKLLNLFLCLSFVFILFVLYI